MTTCAITVRRVAWPHTRRRPGRRPDTMRAHVAGTVDGHTVRGSAGKGWTCTCPDESCEHVDRLAAHIDPDLLAIIDKEADHVD